MIGQQTILVSISIFTSHFALTIYGWLCDDMGEKCDARAPAQNSGQVGISKEKVAYVCAPTGLIKQDNFCVYVVSEVYA